MSYNTLITPFLCMLFLASCISQTPFSSADQSVDVLFRLRFKVHILNGFANNTKPLIIRCHSNDDDLGQHTLWNNQEFRFKFIIDLIKITHFVCNFNWGSKSLQDITVFKNAVETQTCKKTGNCFWKASEDGIYFSNKNESYEKKYAWD